MRVLVAGEYSGTVRDAFLFPSHDRGEEIIDEHSNLLNKFRAFSSEEDYKQYKKEWHEKNKDKIHEHKNKKINCEFCNKEISNTNVKRHQKTLKCMKLQ